MPNYQNTREVLGDQAALDALISNSLTVLADDEIKKVRANAFSHRVLEEIYLPALEMLGSSLYDSSSIFVECDDLRKVYISLTSDTVCAANTGIGFRDNIGRAIFFVPDNLVNTYKSTAPWSTIPNRIKGVSQENEVFYDISEITDSWDTIIGRVNDGTAANIYKIGQYKTIDLYTEGQISFQIVGINTDELADGSGTAQLTFLGRECLLNSRRYNQANVTSGGEIVPTIGYGCYGGWKESELRSVLDNTILPLFPSAMIQAIKSVKKYSCTLNTDDTFTDNEETSDKLWIPSAKEIWTSTYAIAYDPTYDLIMYNQSARIRKRNNANNSYWLRGSRGSSGIARSRLGYQPLITSYGNGSDSLGYASCSVLLGFCL